MRIARQIDGWVNQQAVAAPIGDRRYVARVVNAKEAVGGFLWATEIVEKPSPAAT
jgi:hypothetical protein